MVSIQIDLLSLIARDTKLKKRAGTGGGEYKGACPFCGGHDRFWVHLNHQGKGQRWFCRQCSPQGGDAISYIMRRDHLPFKEAAAVLGVSLENVQTDNVRKMSVTEKPINDLRTDYECFTAGWQNAADDFDMYAYGNLWQTDYILEYLTEKRGLTTDTIQVFGLGYNPDDLEMEWGNADVYMPAGIVIPWHMEGYWSVRVRRLECKEGQAKYAQAKGAANALYYGYGWKSSPIATGSTVIMVEGEFDAMATWQATRMFGAGLKVVATGSSTWARAVRWVSDLSIADHVLLAFDTDEAGENAAKWWQWALGKKAIRLTPTQHDPNDMLLSGDDFAAWVRSVLPNLPFYWEAE